MLKNHTSRRMIKSPQKNETCTIVENNDVSKNEGGKKS
jgi:hypothetical protein